LKDGDALGIEEYLILLSVSETCRYKDCGLLRVLVFPPEDIDAFLKRGRAMVTEGRNGRDLDRDEAPHPDYGVLETITKVEPAENRSLRPRQQHGPPQAGASPLLFGEFLMQWCAFVFLEDISGNFAYEENYLSVPMDAPMGEAYAELEDAIRKALKEHRGNRRCEHDAEHSVAYPNHPMA